MAENEEVLVQVRQYVDNIITNAIQEYKSTLEDKTIKEISDRNDVANELISNEHDNSDTIANTMITKIEILAEEIVTRGIEEGLENIRKMGRILTVGIVCLDLISVCERYPDEDTENLVDEHYWSRGGNASNTSSVLAYLGADVEFFGTLVENRWVNFLKEDFEKSGVKIDNCVLLDEVNHKGPVASLIVSKTTGSRTAFPDFRNVTEISFEDFKKAIQLDRYKWVHFEGRRQNNDIEKMIERIAEFNKTLDKDELITISVELEQPHSLCPELFRLFSLSDVVFVSKVYANDAGFNDKESAVNGLYKNCKLGAILICTWGDQGAAARWNSETWVSAAFSPDRLVDTIGAGDTFNGAAIYALHRGCTVPKTLEFACKVAGRKCGSRGFTGIKGMQTLF